MANPKVKILRSSVPGKRPGLDNIELGELALNTNDGHLFAKRDTSGVGIATTVALLTPWEEDYEGGTVEYDGNTTVTGISSAQSFKGDGATLSGVVTSIIAGSNISVNQSSGQVTVTAVTGLANTANVVADTLVVSGIATIAVVSATDLVVSGASTFTGIGTFESDLYVTGNLNVVGDIIYDEVSGRDLNITGVATVGVLSARDGVVSGTLTATNFVGNGSGLYGITTAFGQLSDVTFTNLGQHDIAVYHDGEGWINDPGASRVVQEVRNTTGFALTESYPVFEIGYNQGNERVEVAGANADSSATMPALGIIHDADLGNNSNGYVIISGIADRVDTSDYSEGDELYVAVGGGLTNTRPPGATALIQKIGTVLRSHTNTGSILVQGAGRTNDVPNTISVSSSITAADGLYSDTLTLTNDASVGGALTVSNLTLSNTGVAVTAILDEDGLTSDRDDALATQQSIKAYVDAQVIAQDLDFTGDSGTGAVDLDSQTFTVSGTTNEIVTSAGIQTLTIGMPDNVIVGGALTVTTDLTVSDSISVTNDATVSGAMTVTTDLTVSDSISVTNDANVGGALTVGGSDGIGITTDTITGPAEFIIDPAAVGDNTGLVRIKGDLRVDGEEFIVSSKTIELADFRVGIATTVATNPLLDGAGIGIGYTGIIKTFTFNNTTNSLESSVGLAVTEGGEFKAGTHTVLDRTTLGASVVNSSLTSVGSLTQLRVAGVSTFVGIGTFENDVYIGGNLNVVGDIIYDEVTGRNLNITGVATVGVLSARDGVVSGTLTATSFVGPLTGNSDTATALATSRTIALTGDVVATATPFDGTSNISIAATIQPDSVGLGTDTFGDYIESISGTTNEIEIIGGTGERSTPQIGLPDDVTIGDSLTITNDTSVGGALTVTGAADFNGSIDVDGHAELDNVNVSGVSTFTGIGTFSSDLYVRGNLNVVGDIVYDEVTGRNLNITGVATVGVLSARDGIVSGTLTATNYVGDGSLMSGLVTSITAGANIAIDQSIGNVTITGLANTAHIIADSLVVTGISTLGIITGAESIGVTTAYATTIEAANATFSGNVTIGGTLTYEDVTNIDAVGLITARSGVEIGHPSIAATLTAAGGAVFVGVVTAPTFNGSLDGNSDTATSLETARNFSITGDFVTAPVISFDGTDNVAFAATVTADSIILGTYTSGDYVQNITGTANEIAVSATSGEGSTPQIGLPDDVTIGDSLTVTNDVVVSGGATVTKNAKFDANVTLGNATSDQIIVNGTVASDFAPFDDNTRDLGGDSYRWKIIYGNVLDLDKDALVGGASTFTGIGTFSSDLYVGGNLNIAGDLVFDEFAGRNINVTGVATVGVLSARDGVVSGTLTATSFVGPLTGNADTATALETPRTIALTGDVVATATPFDGTTNISIAATIQPNSVALGDDTTGNYVETIVGTTNEITVTGSGSETAAITLSLPDDVTIGDSLTITNDASVGGAITVTGQTNVGVLSARDAVLTGVVTATTFSGSGANLTNLTGASAATYGSATNVAQVVVDANGRITGISNVAISAGGGTNGVTIENNGSSVGTAITTINFSSNVTATASGSIATITSSGGGGGGDTYQFNTGVTSSISLAATGIGITALTLPSTAGKQYTIYSINASNVATGNTEVNFIGAFDFSGGERSYFAYNIPVPTGLSIEALKQPQILNPSDRITIRSTDFDRNGADDIIDVYITYKEETSSDYFGVGVGTVGIALTSNIGIYTSSTYPSVVQSIRVANRTDVGGKPISIAINNGIRTTYLIDNLIVPKYASIELLETPKRLNTNDVIEVQVDETETIDIQISGKKITS